jgi:SAM-dependent methyltransferase
MLDAVRLTAGTRLLDAGCGSGELAALAVARDASVWGVDCAEGMLAVARDAAPSARFMIGDLERLPYPDAHFDAITACNSIHFAASPSRAVRELVRVSRAGARIAIASTGTREDLDVRRFVFEPAFSLLDQAPPADPFILSEPGALEAMMTGAGLPVATNMKVLSETRWPSFEAAWTAWRAIGSINAVVELVGEARVRAAVRTAVREERGNSDGEHVQHDWWHVAVGEVPRADA